MENEISKVVAELTKLNEYLANLSGTPAVDIIATVTANDPDYVKAVKATGEMPERTLDLVMDYGIWNIFRLNSLYPKDVWDKAIKAYIESSAKNPGSKFVRALWEHIEMAIGGNT